MKKELNIISMEGGILLKDNLVRSSILPRTVSELDRDVNIMGDTEIEGAVYARKMEVENGDLDVKGAVYTKLELHIASNAKGSIIFRKTVASSDTVASFGKDNKLMFMADINAKQVRLSHAFVAGSIFADAVTLDDCVVIGGVFATKSIDMKDCIAGTFNAPTVFLDGQISLLLPSAFSGSPIERTPATRMINLSLADLGSLYKGDKEIENSGCIEMDLSTDEQKTMLSEDQQTIVVYSYSVVGKVLAADLVDFDKLKNHFLIGATALGSQTLRTYDLGMNEAGEKVGIVPEKVCDFFFSILRGTIKVTPIDGTFSIQDLAKRIPGIV